VLLFSPSQHRIFASVRRYFTARAQTNSMASGERRSPPQSSEFCDAVSTVAVSDLVLSLSDKDIQDKIERLTTFISGEGSSLLRDKGEKLRVQLKQLKEEQERRMKPPARVVNEVLPNNFFFFFPFLI
jgi:hypothetical protein